MAMRALRDGAKSGILKYFLLGILVMAAAGLVLTDVGGFFRGGLGSGDVGRAGSETLSLSKFDRHLQRSLSRFNLSSQQAYENGLLLQIMGSEFQAMILNQEARGFGLDLGREDIAREIKNILGPELDNSEEAKNIFQQRLRQTGFSEAEFVERVERDTLNTLLVESIQNGMNGFSDQGAQDLYLFENEKRDIQYISFPHASVTDLPDPEEEQLKAFYSTRLQSYTIPEKRSGQLIIIDNSAYAEAVAPSEDELRQIYEQSVESYSTPERRAVEHLIVKEQNVAEDVFERVRAGEDLKTVAESLPAEDKNFFTEQTLFEGQGLMAEVEEAVFGAEKTGLLPVQNSLLGWHILKLNNITPAEIRPFDQVRDEIENTLKLENSIDWKIEQANILDDALASGATANEVKNILPVILQPFDNIQSNNENAFPSFEGEDGEILRQTIFELFENESSPVIETADGRFLSVQVTTIAPESYEPFEDVRDEVLERWTEDQQRLANTLRVEGYVRSLNEGKQSFSEFAASQSVSIKRIDSLSRNDRNKVPQGFNGQALELFFSNPVKEYGLAGQNNGLSIFYVAESILPELDKNKNADALSAIQETQIQNEKREAVDLFLEKKRQEYDVYVNDTLLKTVYGEQTF